MQDAKALKVRWRDGEQMTPPPDVYITASPFYSQFSIALATFIGTLVLLSIKLSYETFGAMPPGTLGGVQFLFENALQVNETNVHPNLLGSSALAGLAVYVVWGLISAALDKPKEWPVNVKKLIGAVGVSAVEVAAYR